MKVLIRTHFISEIFAIQCVLKQAKLICSRTKAVYVLFWLHACARIRTHTHPHGHTATRHTGFSAEKRKKTSKSINKTVERKACQVNAHAAPRGWAGRVYAFAIVFPIYFSAKFKILKCSRSQESPPAR